MSGVDLVCDCRNIGGGLDRTSIDVTNCETDPANTDGELVCTLCAPVGSCCLGGRNCAERAPLTCEALGGSPGQGSQCLPDTCEPEPGECNGAVMTWVGGRSGAFADPENWDPPQVPVSDGERCDTALVEGVRNATIDLSAAALSREADALLDPRGGVIQRNGRLVVRDSRGLRPVGGRLELDALSPDVGARSLEVGDGSQLLVGGGELSARHVAIGVGGAGELEVVGPAGRFETTGRLAVGASGEGSLLLRQGAQVSSAESLLGELEDVAAGSAVVQDAGTLWSAANLAVGHASEGTLEVRGGARVESELSYVDFLLPGPLSASATIGGRATGSPRAWARASRCSTSAAA